MRPLNAVVVKIVLLITIVVVMYALHVRTLNFVKAWFVETEFASMLWERTAQIAHRIAAVKENTSALMGLANPHPEVDASPRIPQDVAAALARHVCAPWTHIAAMWHGTVFASMSVSMNAAVVARYKIAEMAYAIMNRARIAPIALAIAAVYSLCSVPQAVLPANNLVAQQKTRLLATDAHVSSVSARYYRIAARLHGA